MFVPSFEASFINDISVMAAWMFQDAGAPVSFDFIEMFKKMGWLLRFVVAALFVQSAWSIGVAIDRWMAFSAARKQSRQFAPAVAGALRDGKIDEAIRIAERHKKSHLAKVVTAGLMEFKAHGESNEIAGEQVE